MKGHTTLLKAATILFLLIAIGAFAKYGWTHRKPIFTEMLTSNKINLDVGRVSTPSQATRTQLNQFADAYPWILGINLIKVDFRLNTRSTTYRYYKEDAVTEGWNEFLSSGRVAPLFGNNEAGNQRLINLINGQFSCVKTLDTVAGQLIPVINQFSLATCMAPIPPGYGDFVGFINVFLREQPTGQQISLIEKMTTEMSKDIYERDIVKSSKKFGVGDQ